MITPPLRQMPLSRQADAEPPPKPLRCDTAARQMLYAIFARRHAIAIAAAAIDTPLMNYFAITPLLPMIFAISRH